MIGSVKLASTPPAATPATAAAELAPYAAARAICRRHARSFYFCSFFLPIQKRTAAFAVYAFCRMLDDAVDMAAPGQASARLEAFRERLDGVYTGRFRPASNSESELATVAFAKVVQEHSIPRHYFTDLAHGCEMDLTITRYQTWADLQKYCYHVAGVVGLIMCRVFGLKSNSAREQAVQMGNAMQLTNILRDVKEDLDRGRIYLPQDEMARFNVSEADLRAGSNNGSFHHLMQFQINRARTMYREASQALCQLPNDGSRFTASAMAVIYGGILNAIERVDYDVFRTRAHLTTFQKVCRLPLAWRLCRREHDHALPDVFAAG